MERDPQLRIYATLNNTPELLTLYRRRDLQELTRFTVRLLNSISRARPDDQAQLVPERSDSPPPVWGITAVATPSLDFRAAFAARQAVATRRATIVPRDITPDELIIVYHARNSEDARRFLDIVNAHRGKKLDAAGNAFLSIGSDPGASIADHWCPGAANLAIFGHRNHARRTVRADVLVEQGLRGQSVNVVIIDEGLDKAMIPAKNWGGGLDHYIDTDLVLPAGAAPPRSHGMMIARSILDLAPDAKLYDVPAIPSTTAPSVQVFVSTIQAAYASLIHEILYRRSMAEWRGPWIFVNAWGIFDASADPTGSYTRNTEPGGHPMINLVGRAVHDHHFDIIFAAGNCGQFCPSQTCGRRDRGPGHSIWGANAHPLVITAGAVRSDETWIGYSSQGPGPELLALQKPDLCAPTQFCETHDAALLSSGTSASCAMTAGVVAALRSKPAWDQFSVTPEALKLALVKIPRKPNGPAGWDDRFGFGVLNAREAIAALP
jgi:hypothetical protein